MPEDWGSSRTLSRVEVGGKGQNHHSPAAAASLRGARCPAVRYREKGEVLLPPLPPAGVEGKKDKHWVSGLLLTSSCNVSRKLQNEMLLPLAFFWQVRTLLWGAADCNKCL